MYTTSDNLSEPTFSCDTDRITFIVDNSTIGIISNIHKLVIGPLSPTKVMLETAEGLASKTKFVGTMRLALTDNVNLHHTYDTPVCVYDPELPINILGILFSWNYFGD